MGITGKGITGKGITRKGITRKGIKGKNSSASTALVHEPPFQLYTSFL